MGGGGWYYVPKVRFEKSQFAMRQAKAFSVFSVPLRLMSEFMRGYR